MNADNGDYVDFGYVFLGRDPREQTCLYQVREVEPLRTDDRSCEQPQPGSRRKQQRGRPR